jgi:deoxyhypusine synthase
MRAPVTQFIKKHFRHFNAATLGEAAEAYKLHVERGGKMFLAMAGAMSTAELGVSLATMIRKDKIHAISCTGANLEEDLFNLIASDAYKRIPEYRQLSPEQELDLYNNKLNRITDVCISDDIIWQRLEKPLMLIWKEADEKGERLFPHQLLFRLLQSDILKDHYQVDIQESWLHAAMEKDVPIFVPGWEDSTLGNMFAAACMRGEIKHSSTVRSGLEAMMELANWYDGTAQKHSIGFFQIGGGIAGDFPICVVPMLQLELKKMDTPMWGYFCQISDSTTSYGSYSGAVPNEKITWGKLGVDTPRFVIESDATICAPLIFAYVLGW